MADNLGEKDLKQPTQPVYIDDGGTGRFKRNAIVRFLLDWAKSTGMGMNELAMMQFSDEDRQQFAQLIGYSVSGYGELSYTDGGQYEKAQEEVERLLKRTKKKGGK